MKVDYNTNKVTVVGNVDPIKLREKIEEKTKKKVELISPSPKKDKNGGGGGGEEKKNNDDKKAEKKSDDNKKSKEVSLLVYANLLLVVLLYSAAGSVFFTHVDYEFSVFRQIDL